MQKPIGALMGLTALGALVVGPLAMQTANAAELGSVGEVRSFKYDPYARAHSRSRRAFRWGGFYVGLNGGYGWQGGEAVNLSTDDTTPTNLGDSTQFSRGTIGTLEADGWFGGVQAGYNFQRGNVVFGIETDFQAGDLNTLRSGRFSNPSGTVPIDGNASLNFDWFGTVRGRLGWAFGQSLAYVTGGFAYGQVDYKLHAFEVGGASQFQTRLTSDGVEAGYVIGGGIEHAFTPSWTMKLEYQYINFGDVRVRAPVTLLATGAGTGETASSSFDANFHTVRIGLNYLFP